jgi:hypothetical protein
MPPNMPGMPPNMAMPPMPPGFDPTKMPPLPPNFDPSMMPPMPPNMMGMPPMPPNMSMPPMPPNMAAPAPVAADAGGAFKVTGVASPPPDPRAETAVNKNKTHKNVIPSALAKSTEWDDEEIVPVRTMTMSVDFGNFDMDDVRSDEASTDASEEEEKKSDDAGPSSPSRSRSKLDSPEGSPTSANKTGTPQKFVGGYDRASLLKSHLKKPKISVRKLIQYLRWVNMLKVWPKPLDLQTIHIDLCNGLLLCRLMAKLVPGTTFVNLHKRPLSRKPALANIEQALSVIWRGGRVNNSRIPSALDIYTGKTDKITIMISEIFEVYVIRPLIKQAAPSMLNWMNIVLKQYSRPIAPGSMTAPFPKLFPHFTSGVSLFCLIFHFTGPSEIKHKHGTVKVDPTRMFETPISLDEYRSNVEYVFQILAALRIETFWTPDEFINFHDSDFLLLQLYKIYSFFVDKRCALPPAQGDTPGVSADMNGEPVVTGLHFKQVGDQKDRDLTSSDVLIGNGNRMTVKAPVVVRDATTLPPHFPPGLICANTFDVPGVTHEAPIRPVLDDGDADKGILLNADKRRQSFFKLNAASHFVVEKKDDASDFFAESPMNSSYGSDALNSSFGTNGGGAEDIAAALEKLSLEREKGEEKLSEKEFVLEKEYTKVEMQASMMPASLFDEKFDALEDERVALEEEREAFENKCNEKEAILRATPIMESPRRESTMRSPMTKQQKVADEERKKSMESGWIKATRKTNTQNAAMAKKQQESEARIARSMTRKDGTSFSPFKGNGDRDKPVAVQQFDAFAERMRNAQDQWLASKEVVEIRAIKQLREDRKNRPSTLKANPNGRNGKDVADAMAQIRHEELRLMSIEEERRHTQLLEGYRNKIGMLRKAEADLKKRNDEAAVASIKSPRKPSVMVKQQNFENQLNYEAQKQEKEAKEIEAREEQAQAQAAMQEQAMQEQAMQQQQMMQASAVGGGGNTIDDSMSVLERLQASYDTSQGAGAVGGGAGAGGGGGEDMNMDSLQWLSTPRTLVIKERNSERQFDFRVVAGADVAAQDPIRSKGYALAWGNNGGVAGFISTGDINEIKQSTADPSSMVISLKPRNPQAVCNSGGLTIIVVKCNSFAECTSYRTGLNNLISSSS